MRTNAHQSGRGENVMRWLKRRSSDEASKAEHEAKLRRQRFVEMGKKGGQRSAQVRAEKRRAAEAAAREQAGGGGTPSLADIVRYAYSIGQAHAFGLPETPEELAALVAGEEAAPEIVGVPSDSGSGSLLSGTERATLDDAPAALPKPSSRNRSSSSVRCIGCHFDFPASRSRRHRRPVRRRPVFGLPRGRRHPTTSEVYPMKTLKLYIRRGDVLGEAAFDAGDVLIRNPGDKSPLVAVSALESRGGRRRRRRAWESRHSGHRPLAASRIKLSVNP
jgi:hypothetical protein